MKSVAGIEFSEESADLIQKLIQGVQAIESFEIYGLSKLNNGKGQIRMAHRGPTIGRKRARGVFAEINPSVDGATVVRRRKFSGGDGRASLTNESVSRLIGHVSLWMSQNRDGMREIERVEPNEPGTVQGGRVESNRRKF